MRRLVIFILGLLSFRTVILGLTRCIYIYIYRCACPTPTRLGAEHVTRDERNMQPASARAHGSSAPNTIHANEFVRINRLDVAARAMRACGSTHARDTPRGCTTVPARSLCGCIIAFPDHDSRMCMCQISTLQAAALWNICAAQPYVNSALRATGFFSLADAPAMPLGLWARWKSFAFHLRQREKNALRMPCTP